MPSPVGPRQALWWCAVVMSVTLLASCRREPSEPPAPAEPPLPSPTTAPVEIEDLGLKPATQPAQFPMSFPDSQPGSELTRRGDEIMVAGRLFHTGTRVVLWTDPGGYDAYRTERRFTSASDAPWRAPKPGEPAPEGQPDSPQRYGLRWQVLNWKEYEQVRGGGWPLDLLQQKVDQFVLHYDVVGASKYTFKVLHDDRGLSVQFMLDVDGTIYQTLDVKERAYHATISNHRSVGIEIANRGAYESEIPLREFYAKDEYGPFVSFPARFGDGGLLYPGVYRPIRPNLVRGTINGHTYVMYDLTAQQYKALAHLTAALCTALPKITLDYPRDSKGNPTWNQMTRAQFDRYQGLLGHYHVQEEKYDPGPAFQWEKLVKDARALMSPEALAANKRAARNPVKPGALATMPSFPPPPAPPPARPATTPDKAK